MSIFFERKTTFLKVRLARNYDEYKRNMTQAGSEITFDLAADIARVTEVFREIMRHIVEENIDDISAAFLLEFDNPLTMLSEEWEIYKSCEYGGEFLDFIELLTENGETNEYISATEAEYLRYKHGVESTFEAVFIEMVESAFENPQSNKVKKGAVV